jgi:hypothetical protein
MKYTPDFGVLIFLQMLIFFGGYSVLSLASWEGGKPPPTWWKTATHRMVTDSKLNLKTESKFSEIRIFEKIPTPHHGRRARGGQGRPKVSLGPTIPHPSTSCRQPPLKWSYGLSRGGRLQGRRRAAVLLPPWIPHAVRLFESRSSLAQSRENDLEDLSKFDE